MKFTPIKTFSNSDIKSCAKASIGVRSSEQIAMASGKKTGYTSVIDKKEELISSMLFPKMNKKSNSS